MLRSTQVTQAKVQPLQNMRNSFSKFPRLTWPFFVSPPTIASPPSTVITYLAPWSTSRGCSTRTVRPTGSGASDFHWAFQKHGPVLLQPYCNLLRHHLAERFGTLIYWPKCVTSSNPQVMPGTTRRFVLACRPPGSSPFSGLKTGAFGRGTRRNVPP